MSIEYLGTDILYQNPRPHVLSRHGYFPGLAILSSGDLIALFTIAEAFESADATTWVSRSEDLGKTWHLERPLRSMISDEAMKADGPQTELLTSDYLKPTVLRDGTVVAIGYRFHRLNPEQGISIVKTGGILPGDDIISFSQDEGKTWTSPQIIPRTRPELLEISGPCLELRSGDLVAVAAPLKMPDGSNPSGQLGILLRSRDHGKSWSDDEVFFRSPEGDITPYESRVCEMQDGRLAAVAWAYDTSSGRHHPNHVVVSPDNGSTWSVPINTGHWGQASNLLWLGGDFLLTIHAHRGEDPGIFVRVVDFSGDRWKPLEEMAIYGSGSPPQTNSGQKMFEMFASLKFGQPSLLKLPDGEILAVHWAVEEGQGKIRIHRLRVKVRER
jgi:sialidase-1